jgi:glycosyltransferase involved in cell wall biosynthesis
MDKHIHQSNKKERALRVLFIPQWYPPKDGFNKELGTFCREHVQASGIYDEVAVLVYENRLERWPSLKLQWVDDEGVPTLYASCGHSPIPKTTFLFSYFQLRRAIQKIITQWGRPDIIHTQDNYAYPVMKVAQRLNIPYVVSQHSSAFMRRTLNTKAIRQYRHAFAEASCVLPANKFAEKDYKYYGLQPKTAWLPNTLDSKIFYHSSEAKTKPWLLHASTFDSIKRFPDILEAFSKVRESRRDAVLQIVGDSPERHAMEVLASKILPPDSYCFHGYIVKSQLANMMRSVRGFVLSSEIETFGCVLMEAMACGCPVLTTKIGGIPAVVREREGLFFDVGNINQMAEGMIKLLDETHGLDTGRISRETRDRFNHDAIGRLLHNEHKRAFNLAG